VDPGDVWTGVAELRIEHTHIPSLWEANTRVLNGKSRTLAQVVDDVLRTSPTTVVVENYQQRPVGHQRFHASTTTKIIGALEYLSEREGIGWHLVPPGNPAAELPQMPPFWKMLRSWSALHDASNHINWIHAMAAWRVMGRWMIGTLPELYHDFQKCAAVGGTRLDMSAAVEIAQHPGMSGDIVAPSVQFIVPRKLPQR
jgi:hypothetical protein